MSAIRCVETAGCIAAERLVTGGRVMLSRRGSRHRGKTIGRVVDSGCVVQARLKTNGVVSNAACKAEQGISPLSRVEPRIAAVRGRDNRSHCGRKPKADEYEREDHKNRCKQTLFRNFTSIFYSCIHCRSRYGRRNGRHSGALVGFCCTTYAVMRAPSFEVERDLRFRQGAPVTMAAWLMTFDLQESSYSDFLPFLFVHGPKVYRSMVRATRKRTCRCASVRNFRHEDVPTGGSHGFMPEDRYFLATLVQKA